MREKTSLFMMIGAGAACWLAYDWRRRQAQARQWAQKPPAVAVITGASSGIGEAFARHLAREGYDLILLARRKERLEALAAEVQRDTHARVEIWTADLSSPLEVERIEQRIAALDRLDLLVNNAGFGLGGRYVDADIEDSVRMVQVHVTASMRLVRAALPGMIRQGHGGIINVSSISGFVPVGGTTVYGATKSYLNFFTESLEMELKGSGVRVQALCPGFTRTEFHDQIGRPALPSLFWMKPDQIVQESLRGMRENQLYVVPGLQYKLLVAVLKSPLFVPFIRWSRSLVTRQLVGR